MKRFLTTLLSVAIMMTLATSCEEDQTDLDDLSVEDSSDDETLDTDFPEDPEEEDVSLYPDLVQVILEDERVESDGYEGSYVELNGSSSVTITGGVESLGESIININSIDARVYLPAISYEEWSLVENQVLIFGRTVIDGVTGSIKPYYDYVYIEPISPFFSPAMIYAGEESYPIERSTIYLGADIPLGDNTVDKIFLKRGHQIVVAASEDGTVSSKCYVAVENDLTIELESELAGQVSFIRCLAVDYVNKRGVSGSGYLTNSNKIYSIANLPWYYNWTPNRQTSTNDPDINFMPMYNSAKWVVGDYCAHETIINNEYPLLMAFNEPDNSDQSNLTVDEAIELYREMHKLGVRLGSPSTEQVGNGSNNHWEENDSKWINMFMAEVEAQGLRVDVMGMHWYDIGSSGSVTVSNASASATRFMNNAKQCYNKYGLPIIATEWNCAGMGSTSNPDWDIHAAFFRSALPQMEACEYIERYALFPPGGIGNMVTTSNGVTELSNGGSAYLAETPTTPSIVAGDHSRVVVSDDTDE